MQCYACEQEATQRCPRCGNPYCGQHGSTACAACLDPVSAAPSANFFRLALIGLLGGSVLALWLLIRPPSVPGEGSTVARTDPTATPALTPAGDTSGGTPGPTVIPSSIPPGAATPTPGETQPAATPAPTVEPTAAPGPIQYTVVEGDSWNSIAAAYGLDAATLAEFNGRVLDDFLQIGEVIQVPR